MLTGKSFRLKTELFGIEGTTGKRVAIRIPAKEIIQVTGGPTPSDTRMVDVEWKGRRLVLFADDIRLRGEEVKGKSTSS